MPHLRLRQKHSFMLQRVPELPSDMACSHVIFTGLFLRKIGTMSYPCPLSETKQEPGEYRLHE